MRLPKKAERGKEIKELESQKAKLISKKSCIKKMERGITPIGMALIVVVVLAVVASLRFYREAKEDTVAPSVSIDVFPGDIHWANVENIPLVFRSNEAGSYKITIDDEDPGTAPLVLSGSISAGQMITLRENLRSLSDGIITVVVEVRDAAGNVGRASATATKYAVEPEMPEAPFSVLFSLENVESGRTWITIRHILGDRAPDVIEVPSANTVRWKNLELRVNGVVVQPSTSAIMVSEGTPVDWTVPGTYSMEAGDLIRMPLGFALKIGDKVSLKWVPKDQLLVEKEVMY